MLAAESVTHASAVYRPPRQRWDSSLQAKSHAPGELAPGQEADLTLVLALGIPWEAREAVSQAPGWGY